MTLRASSVTHSGDTRLPPRTMRRALLQAVTRRWLSLGRVVRRVSIRRHGPPEGILRTSDTYFSCAQLSQLAPAIDCLRFPLETDLFRSSTASRRSWNEKVDFATDLDGSICPRQPPKRDRVAIQFGVRLTDDPLPACSGAKVLPELDVLASAASRYLAPRGLGCGWQRVGFKVSYAGVRVQVFELMVACGRCFGPGCGWGWWWRV
jgi:hypothetical protein